MSVFFIIKEVVYLMSFAALVQQIRRSKNCLGISCKTQEMYIIAYMIRYLEVLYNYNEQSAYLMIMRTFFIVTMASIIYLMRVEKPYSVSYNASDDDFKYWTNLIPGNYFLINQPTYCLGAAIAALVINESWTFLGYVSSFSIWLEAVALIPQVLMFTKFREIENLSANYMAGLGCYQVFNLLDLIQRHVLSGSDGWLLLSAAVVQAIIYANFYYYYFQSYQQQRKVSLPV